MKKRKMIVLAAIGLVAAGIVSAEAQRFGPTVMVTPGSPLSPNTIMVAPGMPPPLRTQVIPRSPRRGFVWAPGSWAWNGGTWVWVPGAWVRPPRAGAVWVSPRWNRRGRGAAWTGGFWR